MSEQPQELSARSSSRTSNTSEFGDDQASQGSFDGSQATHDGAAAEPEAHTADEIYELYQNDQKGKKVKQAFSLCAIEYARGFDSGARITDTWLNRQKRETYRITWTNGEYLDLTEPLCKEQNSLKPVSA